ncbi:MAG: polysaccharide deacetylase family protein [Candidatus Aenigmatarchaeota archaeon]
MGCYKTLKIVLVFHRFYEKKKYIKDRYSLSLNCFERIINFFKKKNFVFVRLKELNKTKKKNVVCLTFDDGDSSQYGAFQIMKKYGVNGTFFIITNTFGQKNYLTVSQIKELRDYGMEVGSHTASHKDLTMLKEEELIKELQESKNKLESILHTKIVSISLPGGKYNQNVIKNCSKYGYKFIRTSDIGFVDDSKAVYPAIPIQDNFLFKNPNILTSRKIISFLGYLKEVNSISNRRNELKPSIKGIFHIHSDYSHDGKLSLENLKNFCLKNDIKFVFLTEHAEDMNKRSWEEYKKECEKFSSRNLVLIPGLEISCKESHILLIDPKKYYFSRSVKKVISYCKRNKILFVFAHVSPEFYEPPSLSIVEVWNKKYHGTVPPVNNLIWLKKMIRKNKFFYSLGGNDAHKIKDLKSAIFLGLESGVNYKNVKDLKKNIINNLKMGKFFSYNKFVSLHPDCFVSGKLSVLFINEIINWMKNLGRRVLKI